MSRRFWASTVGGREVLSYLPGRVVDIDTEMLTEKQLTSIVSGTRSFHEAVTGFSHEGPWRFFKVAAPTLIGHNDIAPYNVCFEGDERRPTAPVRPATSCMPSRIGSS